MEPISEISEEEVLNRFFEKFNLQEYINEFKNQKIFTYELLKELTDEDLQKIGISALGDRKRIIKLLQGSDLDNFRNSILYKNIDKKDLQTVKVKENEVLKKNKCRFKYLSGDAENGELTLYCNRIIWNGDLNNFTIPIIEITDVSVKSIASQSTLIITANDHIYNFIFINKTVGASAALAAFAGFSDAAVVGVAMMNDKPISDIEFWRQKIETLREEQKKSPSNFGIFHEKNEIKTSNEVKVFVISIIVIVITIIIGWNVWLFTNF